MLYLDDNIKSTHWLDSYYRARCFIGILTKQEGWEGSRVQEPRLRTRKVIKRDRYLLQQALPFIDKLFQPNI